MTSSTDLNQSIRQSEGKAMKGSKSSIQHLINTDRGRKFTDAIKAADLTCSDIKWLSPLEHEAYREYTSTDLIALVGRQADLSFWPRMGPQWDAVGMDGETLILVEAKSHVGETSSKLRARSPVSLQMIRDAMQNSQQDLVSSPKYGISSHCPYDQEYWENRYYQLANRLSFFARLNEQGISTKLVLVNFVNDPTWNGTIRSTSREEFESHYQEVFLRMLGSPVPPVGVSLVYL